MNPRRRRHQRIRRKARKVLTFVQWRAMGALKKALTGTLATQLESPFAIRPGVVGRVRSVDRVTGVAEIDVEIAVPTLPATMVRTAVKLRGGE